MDRFGNVRNAATGNADNSTLVSAARAAGSGTLQGTTNLNAVNGIITYTNLSLNVATNITISFTSSGLTGVTSSAIAVSPAAGPLVVAMQPGNATPGSGLSTTPGLAAGDGAPIMTSLRSVSSGVKITFTGSAGRTFQVERAAALQARSTVWETIGTATTDSVGQGEFTDTNPPSGQGYYRAVSQ
jgi:hypothetical protein